MVVVENSTEAKEDVVVVQNTTEAVVVKTEIPQNAVRTTLKLEGNFNEFISSGGKEKFVTDLATNLGLDTSQITIIDAYEGSIVLLYDITPAEDQSLDDITSL